MSGDKMPRREFPCGECPWQVKAPVGKFPPERYEELRATCRPNAAGMPPLPGTPMFGCHVGDPRTGEDLACAGWLAVEGHNHIGVRLALRDGRLPLDALERGDRWPELYPSYEAMATANGVPTRKDVP
ncbi:DUF6283 family protein [Nonomuraea bangladeshensis]|uniref:DUF6283 family protein n=1 Tax=Nonomuraea bangladeshensis TaxID=404385 RepID=UPI0031DE0C87